MRWHNFILTAILVAAVGCSGDQPGPQGSGNTSGGNESRTKKVIGVSVQTLQNPFFKLIGETITAEAGKHGFEVTVLDAQEQIERQNDHVKEFIANEVDAIVLCPRDTKAIGAVIKNANESNIPVFTVDTLCEDKDAKVVFHVGTNNVQGGHVAGKAMIDALGGAGGKVAVLELKNVESCIDRVTGFTEEINSYNETAENKIEIVGHYESEGNKEKGQSAAREALIATPDLVGIFCINDPAALGAYAALEAESKADSVVVVGFDGQPEGKEGVDQGKLFDTPVQFPDRMANETVKAIIKFFDGEEIDPAQKFLDTEPYRRKTSE